MSVRGHTLLAIGGAGVALLLVVGNPLTSAPAAAGALLWVTRRSGVRHTILAGERGSIMVEVLIGTLLLGLTTTAVLNGLDGAQETGRKNKDRSVSATLAQQDIERMRSMHPTVLSNLRQTRTVAVASVNYTIVSRSDWVVDTTGLVSCVASNTSSHYMKLTSTVSSPASAGSPVSASSLLTPPPGIFDNTGTAAVKLTDRDGQALAGVDVDLEGASSYSDTTNEVGCAVFGSIAVGTWTAEVDGNLVSWNGLSPAQSPVTVANQKTSLTQLELDEPASVRATFETPSGVIAEWTSLSVANAKLPGGFRVFPTTAEGTPTTSKDADSLFPFLDGYGVYAGRCGANDPAEWDADYFQTIGSASYAKPDPGELLEPVDVVMPVAKIRVTRSGVAVDAQVTVTQRNSTYGCSATIVNTTTGSDGAIDVPLPFGNYRVCAAYNHSGTWRRQRTSSGSSPLDPNLTTPVEPTVNMSIPTSNNSGQCP